MGLDRTTNQPINIDYAHHEIHGGSSYYAIYSATLASAADLEIRFATGSGPSKVHLEYEVTTTGSADITLFEGTSLAHVVGNVITAINRRRDSSNTSATTICHTPSGSGDGTQLTNTILLGTGIGGSSGGVHQGRKELILKPDTAYLIRVLSNANSNRTTVFMDWYEHQDR